MAITMSSTTESVESMQAVLEGRAPGAAAGDPPNTTDPGDPTNNAGEDGEGDGADAGDQSGANAGASDSAQDEGEHEEEAEDGKPETEHGRRSQRRIRQLTRELTTERRNSQALAKRLERLERTVLAPPPASPAPTTGADGTPQPVVDPVEALGPKPKQEDFATFEEFLDARDEWVLKRADIEADKRAAKKLDERTQQARQAVDQEEDAAATAALFEQIDEVKKGYSNWDEVMESGKDLPLTSDMFDTVKASPVGAHILYHLNRNPQICVGIANIKNPAVRAFEMGRFAQSVENWLASQGKPKGTPSAPQAQGAGSKPGAKVAASKGGRKTPPPPPSSVQGRPGSGVKNTNNPSDFKAWEARRNAELGIE